MTELDQAIATAFTTEGKPENVNKVYLILLRTALLVPTKKIDPTTNHIDEEEPFSPLFAKIGDNYFMIAFDRIERLTAWAGNYIDQMDYVELSGRDVIAGINEQTYLALNLGTDCYKEFSPDEIKKIKTIVSKIDQLKNPK